MLMQAGVALSQNILTNTSTSVSIIPTPTGSILFNGTTTVANPTAFASSTVLRWDDLWDLFVGSVSTATMTTTVTATPVPTDELVPPPGVQWIQTPAGLQVSLAQKNQSWSYPKGFWWGVASAAYQVEGAVKAEGRGPSIWDVLLHRVTGFSVANETGDIADNHYYMYKQGE